ncbi:MAG: polymerase III, delta subunit protein [Candidatus Uhrbacteria bacterium GW2011_GWA2_52_8d]|uniref:DNA-directed DNA polymerase n=1 Tax=Candidatus Uhrbacteria bacterium GW2011_GWA2_52_8d TaxID=1618979 RepID=A0A0G1XKX7_9BACT|nr:MAG: polymerase III, delta subunit protein [Candidatus Uhrbacteria bacterium GW2011_GWA2_52_8d]
MLIFVYGDDTFRVQEKVRQLTRAFREKFDPTGLNLAEFPSSSKKGFELGEVMGAVHAIPFLGQKRMTVVRDLIDSMKKADMSAWVDGFVKTPDSTIVVFWESVESTSLEKKPLFVALKDAAEVHHYPFPALKGAELDCWVQDRVKERGGAIDTDALRAMIERVGADLWQMDNEICKLVAYASGQTISVVMVDELVHTSFEGKIFALIDAVSQRRPVDAIRLLQEERWSGANDHYLLTMLGRQVRILLGARAMLDENPHVRQGELVKTLNIPPFVAQKVLSQARGFTLARLKAVHDLLFDFDLAMKTSGINADLAVDLTTVKLTQ